MSRITNIGVLAASAALFAVAGCATPRPVPELAGAKALISQAEQSDAQQYASADLEAARAKVRQADEQARNDKIVVATNLANEASADAEVAIARTRAIKAEQALRDVNAGTVTLRNETIRQGETDQRSSGTTIVVVPDTAPVPPPTSLQR